MKPQDQEILARPIPETARVPWKEKLAIGAGGIGNGFQSNADNQIYQPVFVLTLGISPAFMSLRNLIERLWDAVSDAMVGWLSDNLRTRWGRRKPLLFLGGLLGGIWLPVIFFFDRDWSTNTIVLWMIGYAIIATTLTTLWNIPYQCMLLEVTPDSRERTNVNAWRGYIGKAGGLLMGWVWFFTQLPIFNDPVTQKPDIILGSRWVLCLLGLVSIVFALLPLFAKCRVEAAVPGKAKPLNLRQGLKETFSSRSFLILLGFSLLFVLGFQVKSNLDFYARFFYVFQGNHQLASAVQGTGHTLIMIVGALGISVFQWIANHRGKRFALLTVMALVFTSSFSTIVCYNPAFPYLSMVPALLVAPAWSAIWVLIPSMMGDVVDEDQLRTGLRREGSYASTYSWFYKAAGSLAVAIAGPLLVFIGFDASLKSYQPENVVTTMRVLVVAIPAVFISLAIVLLTRYPLTTARIEEVRKELERRRESGLQPSS